MDVVRHNGYGLMFVSEDLQGDNEIVMAAVKSDGEALKFASDDIRRYRKS